MRIGTPRVIVFAALPAIALGVFVALRVALLSYAATWKPTTGELHLLWEGGSTSVPKNRIHLSHKVLTEDIEGVAILFSTADDVDEMIGLFPSAERVTIVQTDLTPLHIDGFRKLPRLKVLCIMQCEMNSELCRDLSAPDLPFNVIFGVPDPYGSSLFPPLSSQIFTLEDEIESADDADVDSLFR